MKATLPILNQIQIATPCDARWEDMVGDDRSRFCGHCEKNVYNLSSMTGAEVVELIREKEGKLCARYYRRHDGTVLTADCPVGTHHRIQRRKRRMAGVSAAFASLFLSGCISDPTGDEGPKNEIMGKIAPGLVQPPREAIAGGLCPIDLKQLPPAPVEAPPQNAVQPEPALPQ